MLTHLYLCALLLVASSPRAEFRVSENQDSPAITIRATESIGSILTRWSSVTGEWPVQITDLSQSIIQTPCGLLRDAELSQDQFEPFAESLLSLSGIVLTAHFIDGERQLVADWLKTYEDDSPIEPATTLDEMRGHAALRQSITLPLSRLDKRMMPAVLRPMMRIGGVKVTGSKPEPLKLEGPGVLVRDLANLLRIFDNESASQDVLRHPHSFFSSPAAPLVVQSSSSLLDVLSAYDELCDLHVAVSDGSRQKLGESKFTGESQSVPASEVHSFVSQLLFANGFESSVASEELPVLLTIHSDKEHPRGRQIPAQYRSVDDFEYLPSLAVSVPMILKNSSARQLPATLRPMLANALMEGLICVEGDSLLIYGRAGNLAKVWSKVTREDQR